MNVRKNNVKISRLPINENYGNTFTVLIYRISAQLTTNNISKS
jgi:hypothetical protein